MDHISDEQKLKWLTTTVSPSPRTMINSVGPKEDWQVADYSLTQLRRQIDQPSFGDLGKLPPELLGMVFRNLTCNDLEALHSSSTGGRIAVLGFPQYHNILMHAPSLLAILKKTQLARSFSITTVYETFVSTLCMSCGHFGGYVFLPSFTRCCIYCAENLPKFLPISRASAKTEFGVKGKKILDGLPQFNTIQGWYSTFCGDVKHYKQHMTLFSHQLVYKIAHPDDTSFIRYDRKSVSHGTMKAYQRYMALTPFPSFIPKSASMERGLYCAGCALRAKEHGHCYGSDRNDLRDMHVMENRITDGGDIRCCLWKPCVLNIAQDRLHDSRHVLSHLQGCVGAQALLKHKWTVLQKEISGTDA